MVDGVSHADSDANDGDGDWHEKNGIGGGRKFEFEFEKVNGSILTEESIGNLEKAYHTSSFTSRILLNAHK